MSISPHDRASAIVTTVARAVCCAPEPPRSAKFNSRRDNPFWVAGAGYAECYTAPEAYWLDLR